MKKADVKVGMVYLCKVGRQVTEVRLDSENPHGGWNGTNVKTHRRIRVKSAQRLRALSPLAKAAARQADETPHAARGAKKAEKATKATKAARGRDTAQQGAPQAQETAKARKPSLLNEAVAVLKESGQPMNAKAMVEAVLAKGQWATKGKTPAATLYAAIIREIAKKGDDARFRKVERGQFALNA